MQAILRLTGHGQDSFLYLLVTGLEGWKAADGTIL